MSKKIVVLDFGSTFIIKKLIEEENFIQKHFNSLRLNNENFSSTKEKKQFYRNFRK